MESLALGLRRIISGAVIAALLIFCSWSAPQAQETPLFDLAAKADLERSFPDSNLSYLLIDGSGKVMAQRWADAEAISPGSLVKPFLAIAYGEQHGGEFPKVRCLGTASHCWLPKGHGTLGLEEAITQSCNSYFLELATELDRKRATSSFEQYGLTGPAAEANEESLVGLGTGWKESPLSLARAYLQLAKEQQTSTQRRIARGMRDSAARGTARGVDAALGANAALAKTGTAACSHRPPGAADGFTIALYPAEQPRLILLVRVHGVTGAESAKIAGAMLRSLGAGR